ncbi:hypothetical protein [Solidesulfovibrio fructosivorans]|uniref:hypothetical protein n=1 Tax=Solidesulfovibrio fructosivorans TaxID=878 RepID=UPI0005C23DDA|nr:hypothetical protein [Solidesulfovibrio fructosivorans]
MRRIPGKSRKRTARAGRAKRQATAPTMDASRRFQSFYSGRGVEASLSLDFMRLPDHNFFGIPTITHRNIRQEVGK